MTFFRVLALVCTLTSLAAQADENDRLSVQARGRQIELSWEDNDDKLRGMIIPAFIHAGDTVRVVLDVGSFSGAPFDGPITYQWRRTGEAEAETGTVPHRSGWHMELHPAEAGFYSLDLSFRTTRLKVLHATVPVVPSNVPDLAWLLGLLGAAACVAGYTVYRRVARAKHDSAPEALKD
jgi:hypothetical protein